MIKFMYDPIVYPQESCWFGQVDENGRVIPMEKTQIYTDNTFGLKTLDETGRIQKELINGVHLQFTNDDI